MRSLGFLFFLLLLGGFALVALMGRDGEPASMPSLVSFTMSTWQVTAISDEPATAAQTLRFEASESLSGDSGCNLFSGSYRWTDEGFRIEQLRSTRKACEPQLMAAEEALFDALGRAAQIEMDDESVRLLDAEGAVLVSLVALDMVE